MARMPHSPLKRIIRGLAKRYDVPYQQMQEVIRQAKIDGSFTVHRFLHDRVDPSVWETKLGSWLEKLFVGSLSYGTTDDSLRAYFGQFGWVVSAKIVMDRDSGRSKGFGFVEMPTKAALIAMAKTSDAEFEGRRLTVNIAKPMPERSPRPSRY
jgi:hypothetical protein